MSASSLAAIGSGSVRPKSREPRFRGTPVCRPIEDCPSLRELTFDEILAVAEILKLPEARSVFKAVQHGFLHGVDFCPEGTFAVALTDRTGRSIEIQTFAGPPVCRYNGIPARHVIFGDPDWPIGCDSLPLFAHDDGSEIYLVRGLLEFLAAGDLYWLRDKRVFAMPVASLIPQEALPAFVGRQIWTPDYRDRAAVVALEVWRKQLRPYGSFGTSVLRILLREERFENGRPAKNLVDVLSIRAEQLEQEKRERRAARRSCDGTGGVH
jgi:hypothetical protein